MAESKDTHTLVDTGGIVDSLDGRVRLALGKARADVGAARTETNIKEQLQRLIELHEDSFAISEGIVEAGKSRHTEIKTNFDKVNQNVELVRTFFEADLKRVSTELANLRGDIDKLATKEEIKTFTGRIEAHVEAIRTQLGTLVQQKLK